MSPSAHKQSYGAYSRANHTVPKTRQVVMLYDGIIRNLQQAREAMKENKIEERYKKLSKAQEIITGLQMSLDFDSGAEAAQVLYDFYSFMDSRIMRLHRSNNADECEAVIQEFKQMRELWNTIDQQQGQPADASAPPAADTQADASAAAPATTLSGNLSV